ncbi:hypothetical protein DFH09DRAFT_1325621 [Mycena vulgaris]|nr:hypothetical protein DFH09DRAFT_1325621 [Mycena vulgaris]
MSALLAKIVNESYPIVIVQYSRVDYGAGHEERLHWALMVVTNATKLRGPTFHAIDKLYPTGQKTWERAYRPAASLLKTSRCLGLVQIETVKARDFDSLIELVGTDDPNTGYLTTPLHAGWNCQN